MTLYEIGVGRGNMSPASGGAVLDFKEPAPRGNKDEQKGGAPHGTDGRAAGQCNNRNSRPSSRDLMLSGTHPIARPGRQSPGITSLLDHPTSATGWQAGSMSAMASRQADTSWTNW